MIEKKDLFGREVREGDIVAHLLANMDYQFDEENPRRAIPAIFVGYNLTKKNKPNKACPFRLLVNEKYWYNKQPFLVWNVF